VIVGWRLPVAVTLPEATENSSCWCPQEVGPLPIFKVLRFVKEGKHREMREDEVLAQIFDFKITSDN
jgi:hypothetical protein